MGVVDFVMEPSFDCGNNDVGDATFITATYSIGGQDAVEEYMAYRLFPLSTGFGLGEVEKGETSVSKITMHLPEFPIASLSEETNDHFQVRVELVAKNVVGSYARREHDVCIAE
jgi:hypothetical protein